jgi:hypothetical protein
MNVFQRILHRPFFIKLFNWEYWSFNAVYAWIIPIWLVLCLRARSFFFFSASNPGIENGGFLLESKMKIYGLIPREYYPASILVEKGASPEQIMANIKSHGISFPAIAKPDIGARGRGVKLLQHESELIPYLAHFPFPMIVQNFVPYENEVGIFYHRFPGQEKGRISGIVTKEFLKVVGDGVSTIGELLGKSKRAILQLPVLHKMLGPEMQTVLPDQFSKVLLPYGNHARGSLFLDESDRIDERLERAMDEICKRIPGFYYGRLDIRFESWEKLKQGEAFSVIELNGAGSEPTHMYDPRHSLFFAWKEIVRHWLLLWKISRANHRLGISYMPYREGMQMHRDTRAYDRLLEAAGDSELETADDADAALAKL